MIIGIFLVDSVMPGLRDEFGDYPLMFESMFSSAALQNEGVKAMGIEPLNPLVKLGRKANLDIRHGFFDDSLPSIENNAFDLISAREVIYYFSG